MNGVAKGRERDKLLLKLKELEFMKTDAEGLSRRIEIAEKKQEVYQIRVQYYIQHIQETIRRDGIEFEAISPHTLRHTFATRCSVYYKRKAA